MSADDAALVARVRENLSLVAKRGQFWPSESFFADLLALCALAERTQEELDQVEVAYADYVELAKETWQKYAGRAERSEARVAALEPARYALEYAQEELILYSDSLTYTGEVARKLLPKIDAALAALAVLDRPNVAPSAAAPEHTVFCAGAATEHGGHCYHQSWCETPHDGDVPCERPAAPEPAKKRRRR